MKSIIILITMIILLPSILLAFDEMAGLPEACFFPIDPGRIEISGNNNANRDFMDGLKQIGLSSYDWRPFSYNNYCMGKDNENGYTYIIFADCDSINHDWDSGLYDLTISYNVIGPDGEPMIAREIIAEPNRSSYPGLAISGTGRVLTAFHRNRFEYSSYIKADRYNYGGSSIDWHERFDLGMGPDWLWPQIAATNPQNGTDGAVFFMALNSDNYTSAKACKLIPQVDGNGWLTEPFYLVENMNTVIQEDANILHPTMAVSDDGSMIGIVYTHGSADSLACKYTYSTDNGASWCDPIILAYDTTSYDVDENGTPESNMAINDMGFYLYYNSLNEPCLVYTKSLLDYSGWYIYSYTSRVFFGKIDEENSQLIEYRVSDIIDQQDDIIGGCCSSMGSHPNSLDSPYIGANAATAGGGRYIAIAWLDSRHWLSQECSNSEIFFSYSTDWGETWSEDINISNNYNGHDWDEEWLAISPELEVNQQGDISLELVFMNDHDQGSSYLLSGATTLNEIYYYKLPFYNTITHTPLLNKKVKSSNISNYPNPFNPNTTITYEVSGQETISLRIFNIKGQLIKTLFSDKVHSRGSYSVQWDGQNDTGNALSSGIYFCRVEYGEKSETGKMMLLK